MKNKIKILAYKEQNPFANPRFANNGGGYSNPATLFEYKGILGVFEDNNCGEFGDAWNLTWNGRGAGFTLGNPFASNFTSNSEEDVEFAQELYNAGIIGNASKILAQNEEEFWSIDSDMTNWLIREVEAMAKFSFNDEDDTPHLCADEIDINKLMMLFDE